MPGLEDKPSFMLRADNVGFVWKSLHHSHRALEHVTAEFQAGSPYFICGSSGAGKSTLGLALCGLIQPSEGQVLLDGCELSTQRERVGCVFQFPETLFFADTVREELAEVSGKANAGANRMPFETLGIELNDILDRHPHLLSEGYARLTAIALQLARNPDLLIFDEPTIGLDWKHQERVITALNTWSSARRITIIITHDLDLLEALGGSTLLMDKGTVGWSGETNLLLRSPDLLRQYSLLA